MYAHALNRLVWVLALKNISPLARLLLIYISDHGQVVDPELEMVNPSELDEDPLCSVDICDVADWVGCDPSDAWVAADEIERFGIQIEKQDGFSLLFRFPRERELVPSKPADKPEKRLSIYVIAQEGATKIGISRDPKQRILGLQSANPIRKLTLEFTHSGPASFIRRIEREAHAALAQHALGNEWFSIGVNKAIGVVKELLPSS